MEQNVDLLFLQRINQPQTDTSRNDRAVYFHFKRALDFVIALAGLVMLSPVLVLIAVIIRIDSPGPVIFVQNRVGAVRIKGRGKVYWEKVIFPCFKFRTMMHNADPQLHQEFIKALIDNDREQMAELQDGDTEVKKLVKDPRITRIGKFLRKSSLDELPQLVNVLRGEMSLVGPRPAIPYEVEMYKPWHRGRLDAKPGITGMWQVEARSSSDFDEMVRLDIRYIQEQSFWLDLKIIVNTPLVVLMAKGAV
jgi:lipopolysaccharide/colanic/teichoic acid biosynthesis glycosyltransferase